MTELPSRRIRCAIYTRKSSEEGLEQSFNSLHAQREACEAYIKSQQHEGWVVVPALYDDGGFSGGSMDRPALCTLLQDVRDRKVDVVVVYKIDRLTRSLFDFAKIVEILDAASASFVSVTQSFNTTTSMGRLTLNVLLSFAQFEREVTSERIRDKIAASKRKGMFMGGNVPIGYDLREHSLIINPEEAETVRSIFGLYLKLGNVRSVKAELDRRGIKTKQRHHGTDEGSTSRAGGGAFTVGHLYYLLRNPIYIGLLRHKGNRHPGQHPAIVDRQIWEAVQARLSDNAAPRNNSVSGSGSSAILVGKVFDAQGRRLTPTYAVKGARRYRYYATTSDRPALRLPGADLERVVATSIASWLKDVGNIRTLNPEAPDRIASVKQAQLLADQLDKGDPATMTGLSQLVARVECGDDRIRIFLQRPLVEQALAVAISGAKDPITIESSCSLLRRGKSKRLIIGSTTEATAIDANLANAIVRARAWFDKLRTRQVESIADLARLENAPRAWISQQLPLAFLAPDIVEMIATGRQPQTLTVERLLTVATQSRDWNVQRAALS